MCTGAESRGNINGEPVIPKVGGDYEGNRMRTIEGGERACNCGTFVQGLLQRLHHLLTALTLPISASEVGKLTNSVTISLSLTLFCFWKLFFFLLFL